LFEKFDQQEASLREVFTITNKVYSAFNGCNFLRYYTSNWSEQENTGVQDGRYKNENHQTGTGLPDLRQPGHRAGVPDSIFDVIRRNQNENRKEYRLY